jgi:ABC-type glycerol-3-phosphate transport system substrate-binding protein
MRYKLLFLLILVAMVFSACAQATPEPTPVPPPAAEPPAAEPPPAEPAPTQPPAEPAPTQPPAAEPPPAQEQVTLTMGSWRVDDVAQMNTILDAFSAQYPNITINFDPTNPPDYNAVLRTQLEGGTAPDLFYLRSFSTSRQLYNEGFLEPLEGLPGLKRELF